MSTVTNIPEKQIWGSNYPVNPSTVYINSRPVLLSKKPKEGGEGLVYSIKNNSNVVVKIYKQHNCTLRCKAKIEKLLSLHIEDRDIAAPIASVTWKNGEFLGFVMPLASGKNLNDIVYALEDTGWKRKELITLCLTILKLIKKSHNSAPGHDLLIGDINFGNFMVESPDRVTLVDVDSVQIDEFPCPVGKGDFISPELLKTSSRLGGRLRTREDEAFAIAVILFLLLFNAKHPFSHIGNPGTPVDNILTGIFPYNADGSVQSNAPLGAPAFIWASLPSYIRSAFVNSFKGGVRRTSLDEWIGLFTQYQKDFKQIILKEPFLNEIKIDRFPENFNSTHCLNCNKKVPNNRLINGLCHDCIKAGYTVVHTKCLSCGRQFDTIQGPKGGKEKYCPECQEKINVKCCVCGTGIHIRRFNLPEYTVNNEIICRSCRLEIEKIKDKLDKLENPADADFMKIDFFSLFDEVNEFAKRALFLVSKVNDSNGSETIEGLKKLVLSYSFLKELMPGYQQELRKKVSVYDNETYGHALQELDSLKIQASKETGFEDNTTPLLPQLPYYSCLITSIEQKKKEIISQVRAEIREIVDENKQVLLNTINKFHIYSVKRQKKVKEEIQNTIEKQVVVLDEWFKKFPVRILQAEWKKTCHIKEQLPLYISIAKKVHNFSKSDFSSREEIESCQSLSAEVAEEIKALDNENDQIFFDLMRKDIETYRSNLDSISTLLKWNEGNKTKAFSDIIGEVQSMYKLYPKTKNYTYPGKDEILNCLNAFQRASKLYSKAPKSSDQEKLSCLKNIITVFDEYKISGKAKADIESEIERVDKGIRNRHRKNVISQILIWMACTAILSICLILVALLVGRLIQVMAAVIAVCIIGLIVWIACEIILDYEVILAIIGVVVAIPVVIFTWIKTTSVKETISQAVNNNLFLISAVIVIICAIISYIIVVKYKWKWLIFRARGRR